MRSVAVTCVVRLLVITTVTATSVAGVQNWGYDTDSYDTYRVSRYDWQFYWCTAKVSSTSSGFIGYTIFGLGVCLFCQINHGSSIGEFVFFQIWASSDILCLVLWCLFLFLGFIVVTFYSYGAQPFWYALPPPFRAYPWEAHVPHCVSSGPIAWM